MIVPGKSNWRFLQHSLLALLFTAVSVGCTVKKGDDDEDDDEDDDFTVNPTPIVNPSPIISPIKKDTEAVLPATLTLAGFMGTASQPIGGATVTVTVGGTPMQVSDANGGPPGNSVTTSSDGSYLLEFSMPADSTQTVQVTGSGNDPVASPAAKGASASSKVAAQSQIVLTSIVGSYSRLASVAGADGTVVRTESARVDLTQFSTAEAVLAQEANGGLAVTTETQHDAALSSISQPLLQSLAGAIALIIDDPNYALPAGDANTLAFAQSVADRSEFIDTARANGDLNGALVASGIVGSWETVGYVDATNTFVPFGGHADVVSFLPDGRFVSATNHNDPGCKDDVEGIPLDAETEAGGNGWEKGNYAVNFTTARLTVSNVVETNGSCGFSETETAEYQNPIYLVSGSSLSPAVAGVRADDLMIQYNDDPDNPAQRDPELIVFRRVSSTTDSLVGAWLAPLPNPADPAIPDPLSIIYFFSDGTFWEVDAQHKPAASLACRNGGYKRGIFNFDTNNGLSISGIAIDTLGSDCGLETNLFTLSFPSAIHFDFPAGSLSGDKITAP